MCNSLAQPRTPQITNNPCQNYLFRLALSKSMYVQHVTVTSPYCQPSLCRPLGLKRSRGEFHSKWLSGQHLAELDKPRLYVVLLRLPPPSPLLPYHNCSTTTTTTSRLSEGNESDQGTEGSIPNCSDQSGSTTAALCLGMVCDQCFLQRRGMCAGCWLLPRSPPPFPLPPLPPSSLPSPPSLVLSRPPTPPSLPPSSSFPSCQQRCQLCLNNTCNIVNWNHNAHTCNDCYIFTTNHAAGVVYSFVCSCCGARCSTTNRCFMRLLCVRNATTQWRMVSLKTTPHTRSMNSLKLVLS